MKMNEKVKYVKSQKQTRNHTCHWLGCDKQVPPALWGCKSHWFKLPSKFRTLIWGYYRIGQEKDLKPSEGYLRIAKMIDIWIRENYPLTKS